VRTQLDRSEYTKYFDVPECPELKELSICEGVYLSGTNYYQFFQKEANSGTYTRHSETESVAEWSFDPKSNELAFDNKKLKLEEDGLYF
jgi:hypothetical protein